MLEARRLTSAWEPGKARAPLIGRPAVFEMTTVMVRVVVPIVPVDVMMTLQLPSCVAVPGAAGSQPPVAVSRATPGAWSSAALESLRIRTVNVPCTLPRLGRLELGAPRTAPRAHVAAAR